MSFFISGFPKCGNHALQRACEELGYPASVEHQAFATGLPKGVTRHVFIVRDPRNIIVSALRAAQQRVPTQGQFLTYFRSFRVPPVFRDGKIGLVKAMQQYVGWLDHSATHVVRFEDLLVNDKALRRIAAYLEAPYLNRAWEAFMSPPGLTATWTGELSDYRSLWTPEVQAQWHEGGGYKLLERWGYAG